MRANPRDGLAGAEIELVSEFSRESVLKRSLDRVRDMYKFIIIKNI